MRFVMQAMQERKRKMKTIDVDDFMTVRQAAHKLGYDANRLRKQCEAYGLLIRWSDKIRKVRLSEVAQMINDQRVIPDRNPDVKC